MSAAAAGVLGDTPPAPPAATAPAPVAFAGNPPTPKLDWGAGDGRSFAIPALEIIGFEFTLNQFDRHYAHPREDYISNIHTIRDNLQRRWVVDNDPFSVNQFGHPYQGSLYHGFARSSGLSYWEALAYDHAGSVLWEIAGERTAPSINDQINTGFGGSFLGEPLFRMASLTLETASGKPGFWRELGATFLSPAAGFNRAVSDRFDGVFPSHDPAVYTRVQAGTALTDTASGRVSGVTSFDRNQAYAEVLVEYGLPGKDGYTYDRPFDYFNFQFTASTSNTFESILSRGLLVGQAYHDGNNYRGLWGLFGTYDYIAPQVFRVGSTGASVGTVLQWWASNNVAVEATVMAGLGYAAGGVTEQRDGFR
ncbi:MAG TPA: DUF3943 domain-containing protein, partial [Nevskiaceae bacterium]|nr:DUF3943 domain-containing protein [Nevskiaceae bacterium]